MNMMIKVLVPNFREEVQNYGPQYQRKGISISESKISKKASLSLAQQCVPEIGATNRLWHCCHYDDDDFGYDDDDNENIRTEEEEESTWFTYLL